MNASATTSIADADLFVPEVSTADVPPDSPLRFRALVGLVRRLKKGRGAVPRTLGRTVLRNLRGTLRTHHGNRLAIDPRSLDICVTIAMRDGTWDYSVIRALRATLRPNDVFYDIGTNIGYIAVEIAGLYRDQGVKVFGFEPQPKLAHAVMVSAAASGLPNLRVLQTLLGDDEGTGSLNIPAHTIHATTKPFEGTLETIQSPLRTLDGLVARGSIPPADVIKMDVEGAEREVLMGGRRVIAERRPCIVFESPADHEAHLAERRELMGLLSSLAPYRFYGLAEHDATIRPVDEVMHERLYRDVLAVPEGRELQPVG